LIILFLQANRHGRAGPPGGAVAALQAALPGGGRRGPAGPGVAPREALCAALQAEPDANVRQAGGGNVHQASSAARHTDRPLCQPDHGGARGARVAGKAGAAATADGDAPAPAAAARRLTGAAEQHDRPAHPHCWGGARRQGRGRRGAAVRRGSAADRARPEPPEYPALPGRQPAGGVPAGAADSPVHLRARVHR